MPAARLTSAEHQAIAQRYERAAIAFETGPFPEWALVTLFYAGLHLVDARLSTIGLFPDAHGKRNHCITSLAELAPLWPDYRHLLRLSMFVRYDGIQYSVTRIRSARSGNFRRIHRLIRQLLAQPAPPIPPVLRQYT